MTMPRVVDFWILHNEEMWDPVTKEYVPRGEPNPLYEAIDTFGKCPENYRQRYLLIREKETGQVWGILMYAPYSWTESYEDLFISGPVKLIETPREITVYDYVVDPDQ